MLVAVPQVQHQTSFAQVLGLLSELQRSQTLGTETLTNSVFTSLLFPPVSLDLSRCLRLCPLISVCVYLYLPLYIFPTIYLLVTPLFVAPPAHSLYNPTIIESRCLYTWRGLRLAAATGVLGLLLFFRVPQRHYSEVCRQGAPQQSVRTPHPQGLLQVCHPTAYKMQGAC